MGERAVGKTCGRGEVGVADGVARRDGSRGEEWG